MKKKRGYCCPACGESVTTVVQTATLSDCIIRTRKCLYCGYKHDTGEVALGKSIQLHMGVNAGRMTVKEVA